MLKFAKFFTTGFIIWLAIFALDYCIELFQISSSGVVVTLMGLKIRTEMTAHSLNSYFSLTTKSVVIYIIFTVCWILVGYFYLKIKGKKIASE